MRLLVTGGFGFIGSNFVRRVLRERSDVSVVNLDLCTYAGNPANLADAVAGLAKKRYEHVKGDIADPKVVERCMKGVDAVVHFAAETHVDRSIIDASAFLRTNVTGTYVLLEAAKRRGVSKFVHVSTDEVYGSIEGERHSIESDPLLPNSPYAASKASSDLMARAYFVTHGLPVCVTRASNNFGPYQFPEKAVPLMITNWIDGLPFPLYGDGKQIRDWVYVEDHARAVELVLDEGLPGEIYNVGGTYACENVELVRRVRELMRAPENLVKRVPDRPGHDRRYALDCAKLRALGYEPQFDFETALRLTVDWFKNNERWWRPLKKGAGYKSYYKKQYGRRLKAGAAVSSR